MSDIKFNCATCKQSLETPSEMAGQLIDCPTCKEPIEIPFPPRVPSTVQMRPVDKVIPATQLPGQRTVLKKATSMPLSSTPPQSPKPSSPGLILAVVFLAVVCVGLGCGMFYLIKIKNVNTATGQGTPVAPTKEDVVLARLTAEKETLVEKVLPDVTVDGEVFIVTKGGQNIKLGLVEVALIPMETLAQHLDDRRTEITNAFARLDPQIDAAKAEEERLQQEEQVLYQTYLNDIRNNEKKQTYRTAQEATSRARENVSTLETRKWSFRSAAFYFESLPTSLRVTKTNSDGRFRLLVPGSGNYAIAAIASRHVMDYVERYYWLLKVNPKAGGNQTIMLSNDNKTSSVSEESLIHTL